MGTASRCSASTSRFFEDGTRRGGLGIPCGVTTPSSPAPRPRSPAAAGSHSDARAVPGDAGPADVAVVANPVLRGALQGLGWLAVALGAIGVVLPGWPTTVWLLVAAFLFARSSPRFYRWLLNHRLFGPTVRDVRAGLGLPATTKAFAVSMIVLFAGSSSVLLLTRSWLGGLVAVAGAIGIAYVLRLPTKLRDDGCARSRSRALSRGSPAPGRRGRSGRRRRGRGHRW